MTSTSAQCFSRPIPLTPPRHPDWKHWSARARYAAGASGPTPGFVPRLGAAERCGCARPVPLPATGPMTNVPRNEKLPDYRGTTASRFLLDSLRSPLDNYHANGPPLPRTDETPGYSLTNFGEDSACLAASDAAGASGRPFSIRQSSPEPTTTTPKQAGGPIRIWDRSPVRSARSGVTSTTPSTMGCAV